jgi:hypothetical protein
MDVIPTRRKVIAWIPIVGAFAEVFCEQNYLSEIEHPYRWQLSGIYHAFISAAALLGVIWLIFNA